MINWGNILYQESSTASSNKGKMIHSEIKQEEEYEKQKSVQIQERNHIESFIYDDIESEDFYSEYVSSKQRNRMKKFLKDHKYIPSKDDPNVGTIESDIVDPETGKKKRVEFHIDTRGRETSAQGDSIYMKSKTLKQHPSISNQTFGHEQGHIVFRQAFVKWSESNPKKYDETDEQYRERFMKSGELNKQLTFYKNIIDSHDIELNSHGLNVEEYFADNFSQTLFKDNDVENVVRALNSLKSTGNGELAKRYKTIRKSIEKSPIKYIISQYTSKVDNMTPDNLEAIYTDPILKRLWTNKATVRMYRDSIESYNKSLVSSRRDRQKMISMKSDKKTVKMLTAMFDRMDERTRNNIKEAQAKIDEIKNENRLGYLDLESKLKNVSEEQMKKDLLTGLDNLIKTNDAEIDLRIKIVKEYNASNQKNIKESFSFDDVEDDFFFQESDDIDRIKNKIAECSEEITELEAMLKKNPNNVTKEILLEDAKKRMRRWKNELEELDENAVKPSNNSTFKPNIRYDASTGMNIFTINKNTQNESEFNKIYEICKKMKNAVNDKQWSSFESNASMFYKEINISDYESRRMMLNTIDKNCIQIWFTNAETKVNPTNMRFFHCSHTSSHVELKPTHVNAANTIIYPCNAVFFIAINNSDNIDKILSNFKMYGENVYEYIPSRDDIIYTDSKERRENRIPAVFIKTNKPLKVNKYQIKASLESYSFDSIDDDYFSESVYSFDKTIDVCKELCKCWSKFDYGIPINGRIYSVRSAKEFCDKYRFLSPEDFEKYGGGVCWDFIEWGATFLRSKGIQFHQYYLQTDTPPNYDTHTFIVCKCGDKFVYPECAFSLIASDLNGVGTFNSLPEIYNYIASKMFECNGNKERFKEFKFSVQEYTQTPSYGCTCKEYTDFMKEHGHLVFKGVAHPDSAIKEHYVASSDKFVDYLHWKTEQYIQDNFDIIQEATKATKTRRMKKKILRDINADKNGFGTITDNRGNKSNVRVRFGTNNDTHTNRGWDPDKGMIDTIYINNNDMRRDNAIPVYHHEKNHISINKRCGKQATSKTDKMGYAYDGYVKVYNDKQDVDDIKLIKMFIEKHRDELMSKHSMDVEEYLADINSARDIGYKRMIKMLDDIRTDTNKKLSPSAKYHKDSVKKRAMNKTINDDKSYEEYLSALNDMKEYHNKLKKSNASNDVIKDSERLIADCEKALETRAKFNKYMQNKHHNDESFISRYHKFINEYNNDLKYRILFLREMAKYDKTKAEKKSEKVVTESYCVKDPLDQLCTYMFDKHPDDHHTYEYTIIFDYLNGFLDKSVYSESDIHDMTNDVLSYIVLDDLESDVIDDIYYEADIYSPDNNDIKTYLEFKIDIINYINNQEELDEITEAGVKRVNDEGNDVPEKCDECGGDVTVIIQGEPIWLCKECRKYFGTVPCNIQESKLTTTKRDKLKDSEFGIPEKRTFPLNDKNHVEAAVRMFPHADDSDKEELARRILRKAHHFGMDTSKWDLNKYIQEDAFEPIHLDEIIYTTASSGYKPEVPDESQINPFVSFDKVPLNDFIINRYKPKTDDFSIGLKHLHMNNNSKGFLWLNQKDDVVGYVCVDYPNITMIELSPNYQHKGLGRKLLNFATDYLGGRNLCVSKRNENAIKMLKHCGWNVCDETTNMCLLNKTDKE